MIRLNADETSLLLATKGHAIKGVTTEAVVGTIAYIQAVCDFRCAVTGANVFIIYMELARRIFTIRDFAGLIERLHRNLLNPYVFEPKIEHQDLTDALIAAFAIRRVDDLELDLGLIQKINPRKAGSVPFDFGTGFAIM